jgi:hypothetical protein
MGEKADWNITAHPDNREEVINERKKSLLSMGFDEAFVEHIATKEPTLVREGKVTAAFNLLRGLGFEDPVALITRNTSLLWSTEASMRQKIGIFTELGFKDAIGMISKDPTIFSLGEENIRAKVHLLRSLGFKSPVTLIEAKAKVLNYSDESIKSKPEFLKGLGFQDPIKFLTACPDVFGQSEETFQSKIELLRELGFQDPIKMVTKAPAIAMLSEEGIRGKVASLEGVGIKDPIKLITLSPTILNYSTETISEKMSFLTELGFDAAGIISKFPAVITLGNENILKKIKLLNDLGFQNVKMMVGRSPSTLSLAEDNIRERFTFCTRILQFYKVPLATTSLMEYVPNLWNTKKEKISILLRLMREYQIPADKITAPLVARIFNSSLEDLLVAFSEGHADHASILDLVNNAKRVGKRKVSKLEKRKYLLEGGLDQATIKDKLILKRYIRGYGAKNTSEVESELESSDT